MNTLKINKFKAFNNEIILGLDNKSILIYGENGAGKSSIYEAIKVLFFKNRLEKHLELEAITPEYLIQAKNDFWSNFNNKNEPSIQFEISVNDTDYTMFNADNYQLSMISLTEIFYSEDKLNLLVLLQNAYLNLDVEIICSEYYKYIEVEVNDLLSAFQENIKIEIDKQDDYNIKITDDTRGLTTKSEIKRYFNEAKLHLIKLLLLFESIRFGENIDKPKRILVLDDFITSLDIANRTFLVKYILSKFDKYQVVILTHNITFFNLIIYLINDVFKVNQSWKIANIYEIKNKHKLILKNNNQSADKIKTEYHNGNITAEVAGNQIRQKFEVLLYELSKLFMIGAVEDSKKILTFLEKEQCLYLKNSKNSLDLVKEIEQILNSSLPNKEQKIKDKVSDYKISDFQNLKEILKSLKLYRKVTMHPLSHGTIGQTTFTNKEIENSLDLLELFEKSIKDLINKNI